MLQTVEGIIDVNGDLYLSEPLPLTESCRALVTVLDEKYGIPTQEEMEMLKIRYTNRVSTAARTSEEKIEIQSNQQ